MEEKTVKETTKKLCTARPKYTAQLTDTGPNGQIMEIVVLLVEMDTNTEQENVLDRNTEENIVKETTKKLYTAKPKYTAQSTDTGLNMEVGRVAVKHAAKEFRHVAEFVMSQNTEAKLVMALQRKPKIVFSKRNVSLSQFVHARNTNWKNSLA